MARLSLSNDCLKCKDNSSEIAEYLFSPTSASLFKKVHEKTFGRYRWHCHKNRMRIPSPGAHFFEYFAIGPEGNLYAAESCSYYALQPAVYSLISEIYFPTEQELKLYGL